MAIDAYVVFKEPGAGAIEIKGETTDKTMSKKDAFEILSFSMGAENFLDIGSMRGGSGAGRVKFKDFTIEKKTDRGSPGLFLAVCNGGIYGHVELILRRSGGQNDVTGVPFLQFTMKLVAVRDIQWEGDDDNCKETVIFEFGAVQIDYTKMDETGKMGETKSEMWSRIHNSRSLSV